jgi:hypothetical protein
LKGFLDFTFLTLRLFLCGRHPMDGLGETQTKKVVLSLSFPHAAAAQAAESAG